MRFNALPDGTNYHAIGYRARYVLALEGRAWDQFAVYRCTGIGAGSLRELISPCPMAFGDAKALAKEDDAQWERL